MKKTTLSFAIATLLLGATHSQAGGLWLNNFGDFYGGRSSAGARSQFSDTLTLGGHFNYADLGSAKIHGEHWGGDYGSNAVYAFSAYLNWLL